MVAETRPVLELVDPSIALTVQQIALARQMAQDWLAPLAACIGLMLPPGLEQQADLLYTAHGRQPDELSQTQKRLLTLLYQRGPLRGQQIDHAMRRMNWRLAARPLIRRQLLTTQPILPAPTVKPSSHAAQLACSPQQAETALPDGRADSPAWRAPIHAAAF
jgi:primosomal protein N'